MAKDSKKLNKRFKDARMRAIKNDENLVNQLKATKEIKGSEVSESQKATIYSSLLKYSLSSENPAFEIGLIVVDTKMIKPTFRENRARSFNYLLSLFLQRYQRKGETYTNGCQLSLLIDEQNIATGSRYTLKEYLNIELRLKEELFKDEISVSYMDSKNSNLIQFADFLANTTFRALSGNDFIEAKENLKMLKPLFVGKEFFNFPIG